MRIYKLHSTLSAKWAVAIVCQVLIVGFFSGYAATYTVINEDDSGLGSLREAILNANANAGLDTINFAIVWGGTVKTISPTTPLPDIIDKVIIDGSTQSGYVDTPVIEIRGNLAGFGAHGLILQTLGSTIKGLAINQFYWAGILILNGGSNTIQGCHIGTDAAGVVDLGNGYDGLQIVNSPNNTIGGLAPTELNVFSGNQNSGVSIMDGGSRTNTVIGNYIGTTRGGTGRLGNNEAGIYIGATIGSSTYASDNIIGGASPAANVIGANYNGIYIFRAERNRIIGNAIGYHNNFNIGNTNKGVAIEEAAGNFIGGTNLNEGNIIAGNLDGIAIMEASATNNVVWGNEIGSEALGNSGYGVLISTYSAELPGAARNLIGGESTGTKNFISGNGLDGVAIARNSVSNTVAGNFIGLDVFGGRSGNLRHGIAIYDSAYNKIGGSVPGAGNVISGNSTNGIHLDLSSRNTGSHSNLIQGNFIGNDFIGEGNGAVGVFLKDSSHNWIGGLLPAEKNFICYNGEALLKLGHGVVIASGTNNPILGNSIWANAGMGIDLANDLITLNDVDQSIEGEYLDTDPNNLQNYPFVKKVVFNPDVASKKIIWGLNSLTNRPFRVEFFCNPTPDDSGQGEGKEFLGSMNVATDEDGKVEFEFTFSESVEFISATATDLTTLDTSEFSLVDTDGDALADAWEMNGIDINADGTIDLPLPGADWRHKDVFVEIDAMESRVPVFENLNRVNTGIQTDPTIPPDGFNNAPNALVQNPDGQDGVTVHLKYSHLNLPLNPWPVDSWDDDWRYFYALKADYFGNPDERISSNWPNILNARKLVYHYCIFADDAPRNDGMKKNKGFGEVVGAGNDFWVAVGAAASSPNDLLPTAVFMHEFGHNLGLGHGGGDPSNFKPNYHSVMNYRWTERQAHNSTGYRLDYSREKFRDLDENHLDESVGIGAGEDHDAHSLVVTPFTSGSIRVERKGLEGGGFDWNGDNDTTDSDLSIDINFEFWIRFGTNSPERKGVLIGAEDWSNLKYNFIENGHHQDGLHFESEEPDLPLSVMESLETLGTGVGVFEFGSTSHSISETGLVAAITVRRFTDTTGTVSVTYFTTNGNALSAEDYSNTSGVLTFAGSETVKTLEIPILDDGVGENPERFRVELVNPVGGATLGQWKTTIVTIIDDDPATHFVVSNTNNSGPGSLRQAMFDANTNIGLNHIDFNIPSGGLRITPATALPVLTEAVIIDATTQPGYAGVPLIELEGQTLAITGGDSVVRGLSVFGNSNEGISLSGNGGNRIEACYVGIDRTGTNSIPNNTGILVASADNIIGGSSAANRNHISGNNTGINVSGANNRIQGNTIGPSSGGASLGNGIGVVITGSSTTVGGNKQGEGNLISGNIQDGIQLSGTSNIVNGNFIGTDSAGLVLRGNGGNGIYVVSGSENRIGGTQSREGNLISGNLQFGIRLGTASSKQWICGNKIGTDKNGRAALPNLLGGILITDTATMNTLGGVNFGEANIVAFNAGPGISISGISATNNLIRGNNIFSNSALGIDLSATAADGVTANDALDSDVGANQLQNYPIFAGVTNYLYGTVIVGTFNSQSNKTYTLDFYANVASDDSSNGEGHQWLGSFPVTTGTNGSATFQTPPFVKTLIGKFVTATASDSWGNTSEFSPCVSAIVSTSPPPYVVTNIANSGNGSLRQAILNANASVGIHDTIQFNIPGAGIKTIAPLTQLPTITDSVFIDGYSQPGSSANTLTNGDNAVILIRLDGDSLDPQNDEDGLVCTANNTLIRGLAITRFTDDGIQFNAGMSNQVQGCYIGLTPDGITEAGNNGDGIEVSGSASQVLIGGHGLADRCLISANNRGVRFVDVAKNHIQGCYIGTDKTGTIARGNRNSGVLISGNTSRLNVIGGTGVLERNVISGNGVGYNTAEENGITLSACISNAILGNYIGTTSDGNAALGNDENGVMLRSGASTNFIGGTATNAGNVISANGGSGILFSNFSPDQNGNIVQGNFIGTDATGLNALGNDLGLEFYFARYNQIGGTATGARNVISGNAGDGVYMGVYEDQGSIGNIFEGNYVGVGVDGVTALGNDGDGFLGVGLGTRIGGTSFGAGNIIANNIGDGVRHWIPTNINVAILGNSIYANSYLGISIGDEPTTNDADDLDEGPNHLQNFPVIQSALRYPTNTVITASLNSRPIPILTYRIEFFDNVVADDSGFGEGQTYLGFIDVHAGLFGNADFTFTNAGALPFGHYITATATDPNDNTSGFSEARRILPFDGVDLQLSISDSDDPASHATNHFYTINITNAGPADATGVFVNSALPAGMNYVTALPSQGSVVSALGVVTCDMGTISNGGFATIAMEVSVSNSASLTFRSGVNATQPDYDAGNNIAAEDTAFGIADMALSLSDDADPIVAGETQVLSATVANLGINADSDPRVTLLLAQGCVFTGASVSQGSVSQVGSNIVFRPGLIGVGNSATITVTNIPTLSGTINHAGLAIASGYDPSSFNNSADETTEVEEGAGVIQYANAVYGVNENDGSLLVEVVRSGGAIGAVTVDYATSNLTALAAVDYAATSGTLTFTNSQTFASFSIPIIDDLDAECAEEFVLTLSNPTGGAVVVDNSMVNVYDDHLNSAGKVVITSGLSTNGPAGDNMSYEPQFSADGLNLAFSSYASNLAGLDTNEESDVFIYNLSSNRLMLVSAALTGTNAGSGYSDWPRPSANGRFVSFYSQSSDLVTNDFNTVGDVFRRDTLLNLTELVSINVFGVGSGNDNSLASDMTPDGRFVLLESTATDLITNDLNGGLSDVFIRDMTSNRVELVSVNAAGNGSANGDSYVPVASASGRFVAFYSYGDDFGVTDLNRTLDVYVRDRQNHTNILCSRSIAGIAGNGSSLGAIISANEVWVVFASEASDLVSSYDENGVTDIFAYDLTTHTLQLVSVNTNGVTGSGSSYDHSISADGRYVAFYSEANDLVANDNNNAGDVFVRDLVNATTTLASVSCQGGTPGRARSSAPQISDDGRYVAFESDAGDLVTGPIEGVGNIYRRDLLTATTVMVSQNHSLNNGGNDQSFGARISTNGHAVSFASLASDIVGLDTNQVEDVYVWKSIEPALPLTPPTMFIQVTNSNQIVISWSELAAAFALESTTNLSTPIVWSSVSNAISTSGTNKFVLVDLDVAEPKRYFRLKH